MTAATEAIGGSAVAQSAAIVRLDVSNLPPYGNSTLPAGIRSLIVNNINGLAIHMLEAGFDTKGRPCILLLHGFPELAYSWRKVMLLLAAAGYHVVAPDQRGYGRTTGWDDVDDGDLDSFRLPNLVRDALGLVSALGYRSVAAVVGHDFGSPVAAYCAVIRPDVFQSVALMSAPFAGPPQLPFDTDGEPAPSVTLCPVFLRTWQGLTPHGNTTNNITKRAKRMITCGELRRASTLSCVPIITIRVLIGNGTSHSS